MSTRNELAAFGLFLLGFALPVAGGWGSIANGPVGAAASVLGFVCLGVAALWMDVFEGGSIREHDPDRRKLLLNAVSVLGVALFVLVAFRGIVPDELRIGLGGLGAVVLLASGFYHRRRAMREEYDEREVRIRYRAAYTAFLVLNGLLLLALFGAFALSPPRGDEVSPATTAVVVAGALVIVAGALAFTFSEGWYRTRM